MLQPKDKPCFAPELRMQLGRPDQLTVITRVTPCGGKAWSYFPEMMMLRNACWAPYSGKVVSDAFLLVVVDDPLALLAFLPRPPWKPDARWTICGS